MAGERFGIFLLLFTLGGAVLTSCQPALTPVPRPTPAVLTVQISPALLPLGDQLRACLRAAGDPGLVLLTTPASAANLDPTALGLRWGASGLPDGAPKGYAASVGVEELAFIIHPQNAVDRLSLADLRAVYDGTLRFWPKTKTEIQPWSYLSESDTQAIFEAGVLGGQRPSRRVVFTAPEPSALREAVAANPAAIGFLPRRWLDGTVKELAISGIDPALLRQPVLAVSQAEPQGKERAWLLCLQEKLSMSDD